MRRPARHGTPQGQVSGVAAHDLDDLHPMVGAGRGADLFDHFGTVAQRRIKAQRVVGPVQIIVDSLGDADNLAALPAQPGRDPQRVFPAQRNHRIELQTLDIAQHFL